MNKTTKLIVLLVTIVFFAVGISCAVAGWTIAGIQIAGVAPTDAVEKELNLELYSNKITYDAAVKLATDNRDDATELAEMNLEDALELAGEDEEAVDAANAIYDTAIEEIEENYTEAMESATLTKTIADKTARLEYEVDLAELKDTKKTDLISIFVFEPSMGLKQSAKTVITGGDTPIDDIQVETSFRNPGLTTPGALVVSSFMFLFLGAAGIVTYAILNKVDGEKKEKPAKPAKPAKAENKE